MRKYYKIKMSTEDGNITFTVNNAVVLSKVNLSTALDHIIKSGAVKSTSGALQEVVYVKLYDEEKEEYEFV